MNKTIREIKNVQTKQQMRMETVLHLRKKPARNEARSNQQGQERPRNNQTKQQ